jgi:predicted DNA-binding transcriptional regulator AlpA
MFDHDAQAPDPSLLTLDELSRILKISSGSIRNQLSRKTFPLNPIRIGRLLRFKTSSVQEYLESLGSTSKADREA